MAAAPVVLEMDVHCRQCAKKIRKSIRDMFGTYACMRHAMSHSWMG